jgi:ATP-dependent Zn protease
MKWNYLLLRGGDKIMNPNVPPPAYQQQPQFYPQAAPTAGNPMMGFVGNSQGTMWLASILWFITWLLIIAVLFALLRWLWAKGEENKKR